MPPLNKENWKEEFVEWAEKEYWDFSSELDQERLLEKVESLLIAQDKETRREVGELLEVDLRMWKSALERAEREQNLEAKWYAEGCIGVTLEIKRRITRSISDKE